MKADRIGGAVALVTGANRDIGRAVTESLRLDVTNQFAAIAASMLSGSVA